MLGGMNHFLLPFDQHSQIDHGILMTLPLRFVMLLCDGATDYQLIKMGAERQRFTSETLWWSQMLGFKAMVGRKHRFHQKLC